MAASVLYLQNNLTVAPWVHCVLTGLNSNIYLVDAKGINKHLYICRESIVHVKEWNAYDQSLKFATISLWWKVMSSVTEVINITIHLRTSVPIPNTTMGLEVRTTDKVPSRGTLGFRKTLRRGYNYTHTENGTNHHTRARVRVASRLQPFPNQANNVNGGVDLFSGNATMTYPAPPSCQLNRQTGHNQLLGLSP